MPIVRDEEMGGDARIEGTRIAVYHILEYREAGFSVKEITDEFDFKEAEVTEAVEFAEEHDI